MSHIVDTVGSGGSPLGPQVRLAQAIVGAGYDIDGVNLLATFGTKAGTNIERDAQRRLRRLFGLELQPTFVKVRVYNSDMLESSMDLATLQLYESLSALYDCGAQFDKTMLGGYGANAIQQYWHDLG